MTDAMDRRKRLADVLISCTAIALASPAFLACALLVRVSSPGPILFAHRRVGMYGRPFGCLKFRTMVVDAESWLERDPELRAAHRRNGFKLPREKDPRVTSVGRFLRFMHLDELPQLWNVLRGEMSMVGPRPIIEEELEHYGTRSGELLSVRPGVFGPWTAMGSRRPPYPVRAEVELSYLEDSGILRDLRILLRNFPVILRGQEEDGEVGASTEAGRPPAPP